MHFPRILFTYTAIMYMYVPVIDVDTEGERIFALESKRYLRLCVSAATPYLTCIKENWNLFSGVMTRKDLILGRKKDPVTISIRVTAL